MEALVDSPRSTGLALQLDDGTRKSHSFAQNSAFVTGFFRGIETRESFGKLVSTLYFVYRAMEKAFDEASDERVRTMDSKPLRRLAELEIDMGKSHTPNPEVQTLINPNPNPSPNPQPVTPQPQTPDPKP